MFDRFVIVCFSTEGYEEIGQTMWTTNTVDGYAGDNGRVISNVQSHQGIICLF